MAREFPFSKNSATNTSVNVATTSTSVLVANNVRSSATFINDSDTVIYLSLSSTASVNSGIRLNSSGGSYEMNGENLYTGVVSAIHGGTGTKVLVVMEM